MRASTHLFAIDLVDEGFANVLDSARERGALDGVVLAASYHQAFDIFPHNPVHRVHAHEAGALYFRPDPRRYESLRIKPIVSRLAAEIDPLGRLVEEADRRGMAVRAWTNQLQATDLGMRNPDCVPVNAFGDSYSRWLCVANPDVRAYVRAASADVARYGVETLILESLCYQPFDLVFLHGRSHYTYSPTVRFCLSLCFCTHCEAAARAAGVQIQSLRIFVRNELAKSLAGAASVFDETPLEFDAVGALADGEMAAFLEVRREVVTSVIAETTESVRQERRSSRVVVMDWSGGLVSYSSGDAEGRVTCERSWQDGFDPATVAEACDGLCMLGYTSDIDRLRTDIEGYRARMPHDRTLSIAMRPMPPDCHSPAELADRIAAASAGNPDWLDFYAFGLMRLEHLDWIGSALGSASNRTRRN